MEDFWKSVQTIQAERGADYRAFSLFSATHWAELLGAAASVLESDAPAFLQYTCAAASLSGPSAYGWISSAGGSHSLGAGFSVCNGNADLLLSQ